MKLVTAISFCGFYSFALGDYEEGAFNDELDVKRYNEELAAGDASEFLGGQHHHEPRHYENLARRFIPVYPYRDPEESKEKLQKKDPEEILQYIMPPKKIIKDQVREIIPKRAPPEVVLAVMRNATEAVSPLPSDPTEEVIRQYMLRSGDYWDSVWKEDVNPDTILRTNKLDKEDSNERDVQMFKNAVPITAKLLPGSKLFDLVSGIVKKTPRLVYIINDE